MSEQNESKGMELYEYIVDHVDELGSDPKEIVDKLRGADQTGPLSCGDRPRAV